MPNIRVSFQGGGAYLAKMIPIAHAISNVERSGEIKIDGVAGASAGAICAALLASDCDFSALRVTMKKTLETEMRDLAKGFYGDVSSHTKIIAITKALLGFDLISRPKLSTFVERLLSHGRVVHSDVNTYHTGVTTPNLFIARSKLTPDYLEISQHGDLVGLVVDSCSVPFALKGFRAAREQNYVDGGMCENLPVKCFDSEDDIPLFAVSVSDNRNDAGSKMGSAGYLMKLFSMMIGYSVGRSRSVVGQGLCLIEEADFGFEEIGKAVDWFLDDDKYEAVLRKHEAKLRGFSETYRLSTAGHQFLGGKNTLSKRNRDMKVLTGAIDLSDAWTIESSAMVITAHSATSASVKPDTIKTISRVISEGSAPAAYRGHIRLAGADLHPTSWKVVNLSKDRSIPFHAIHFQDPEVGGTLVDPCYLVFEDPKRDIQTGDQLEIHSIMPSLPEEGMSGLINGQDFVEFTNHHKEAVTISVVLRYPLELGMIGQVKYSASSLDFREITQGELQNFSVMEDVDFRIVGVTSKLHAYEHEKLSINFVRGK